VLENLGRMESMSGSLRKRVTRVERSLIEFATRHQLRNLRCNCRERTPADPEEPEAFEAEMNLKCPVHSFRRLGEILDVVIPGEERAKLDELLKIYRARQLPGDRLSRLRQAGLKLKHDSEEL
jgi:hypothetical protein